MYGGVSFGSTNGQYRHYDSGVILDRVTNPIEGKLRGGFVGYNWQSGNLVYGGELALARGDLLTDDNPTYFTEDPVDIRGKVGYAVGKALIYGTAGWTVAQKHWTGGSVTNSPVRVDGLSFGLGVDFHATDRVFVGLSYQHVTLVAEEGEIGNFPIVEANMELNQVTFRVGTRF